jgi:23S rRNA pseudouridine1911/1915/1917 synthase
VSDGDEVLVDIDDDDELVKPGSLPLIVPPVAGEEVIRCVTVPESAEGFRIDVFLTQMLDGYSRQQIKDAVQAGGAEVNGKVVRPSLKLHAGSIDPFPCAAAGDG